MAIKPPLLDPRTYDDVVNQVEAVARLVAPPWTPSPAGAPLDPGSVLVRLFARMASQAIDRLNQVPEKSHLAFLDLLGAQAEPPRPARAALTFHPVDGSDSEPVVPAGTLVSAPAAPPLDEAVFATESELVLTRAQLLAAFVRQATGGADNFSEVTAVATGAADGAFDPFIGSTANDYALYLRCDAVLTRPADQIVVDFSLPHSAPAFTYLYYGVNGWTPLTVAQGTVGQLPGGQTFLAMTLTAPPAFLPTEVGGVVASYLRITPPPVGATSLGLGAAFVNRAVALESLSADGTTLDASKDFFPFGTLPRLSNALYLQSADAFAKPGASITITTAPSDFLAGLPSGTTLQSLTLAWDVSTTAGWSPLTVTDTTGNLSHAGTVKLTLPPTVAPATVNGQSGWFVRARVVNDPPPPSSAANATVKALSLKSLSVTCTGGTGAPLDAILLGADGTAQPATQPLQPAPTPAVQALYLGFDRPFANRAETLFVQIAPPSTTNVQVNEPTGTPPPPSPPRLIWEYARAGGAWADLGAEDDTRAFSRSGLVRFIGPADAVQSTERGQSLYWLRVRFAGSFPFEPSLRTISTNTTWAVNAVASTDELLGSSDGSASQSFQTAQSPVLAGERIEVDEAQPPRADDVQALVDLDGPDPVTVIAAEPGQPARIWVRWHPVTDFHGSGPGDRHYVLDHSTGRLNFGDGSNGLIPPAGRDVRAASYQSGGGEAGNRDAGAITQLKAAVPLVDRVTNPDPASGGSDAETLEELKDRAGTTVRHGGRAATAQDYEDLAFAASPDIARAHAVPPTFSPFDPALPLVGAGRVMLVIVPRSTDPQPVPSLELIEAVEQYLAARCAPAVSLLVAGPRWAQVVVTASIVPVSIEAEGTARAAVEAAIARFLHPLTGGRDGAGWAFGRVPRASDFFALIAGVDGVDHVESLSLSVGAPLDQPAPDPRVAATCLIYSGDHQLTVLPPIGGSS